MLTAPEADVEAMSDMSNANVTPEPFRPEIKVNFYAFKAANGHLPHLSQNIGGTDAVNGFYRKCESDESCWGDNRTRFQFCECVARLYIDDLRRDFGRLYSGAGAVWHF